MLLFELFSKQGEQSAKDTAANYVNQSEQRVNRQQGDNCAHRLCDHARNRRHKPRRRHAYFGNIGRKAIHKLAAMIFVNLRVIGFQNRGKGLHAHYRINFRTQLFA